MSALGQKQTLALHKPTPALPPTRTFAVQLGMSVLVHKRAYFSTSKNEAIILSDLRQNFVAKECQKKYRWRDLEAEREFATMTIAESIRSSKYETICGECGSAVMSPEFVEYFSEEQLVLNFWSCANCGFRFETEEKTSVDVEPQIGVCDEAELFPEAFFPSPRF